MTAYSKAATEARLGLAGLAYDGPSIAFHWLTFLLVAAQFVGAWTIDLFAPGAPRIDARSVHITLGALLALLLAARILWRASRGRRLPPAQSGLPGALARGMHIALYGLLVAMVVTGFGLAWARGDNLYGMFKIPAANPNDPALRHEVQQIHGAIGWFILAAVGAHAAAALGHAVLFRDGVLGRMIPGRNP